MNIIDYIKTLFCRLDLDTRPVLSSTDIKLLFPSKLENGYHYGDLNYNSTTLESMEDFLKLWVFKYKDWSKRFDCDNFADVFMGWAKLTNPTQAIGTIWVKRKGLSNHALNFFIYWDEKGFHWAYIEPQTSEIIYQIDRLNWLPYYVRL